jgi:5-methyltetrahydrofolate--homocysteine methyltransferase
VLATVKGDVHDIGKNIVGVVLACNNYEVTDLGVMVPAEKILATAREQQADVIGLSGLITPSLDEMVHVAREMTRQNFQVPLLIGGATTSAAHTAVKIAPDYAPGVVHVLDASRVVNVVSALLSAEQKPAFLADVAARNRSASASNSANARAAARCCRWPTARARRQTFDWTAIDLPRPEFLGARTFDPVPLDEIVPLIDWGPFFSAWELHGRYPDILQDAVVGAEATKLFQDAQALLARIVEEKLFTAKAVLAFWPANAVGDSIEVYADEGRTGAWSVPLPAPATRKAGRTSSTTASPTSSRRSIPAGSTTSAVSPSPPATASTNSRPEFKAAHDDYSAIMAQALGDRLAEALAEFMHQRARQFCGFGRAENLPCRSMIREKYRGVRPAPGYPACPEHTEKRTLFTLLDATTATGIALTESCAMSPASSVSGLYLNHPDAKYFAVGKVARDQVEDYAARKVMSVSEVERWCGSCMPMTCANCVMLPVSSSVVTATPLSASPTENSHSPVCGKTAISIWSSPTITCQILTAWN